MLIIAFGHRQRTGKDTCGRLLYNHLKYEHPKLKLFKTSFFGAVKDVAAHLFAWTGIQDAEYYENYSEQKDVILDKINKTPRQIWLEFGHYLREIDARAVAKFSLSRIPEGTDIAIFTDLRDPAEIEEIKALNPKNLIIRLDRNIPTLESSLTGHPSYKLDSKLDSFESWDRIIENNGSLRELTRQLETLYNG